MVFFVHSLLVCYVVTYKGCNDRSNAIIGWMCHGSHHLGSLLGVNELTVSCAIVCKV